MSRISLPKLVLVLILATLLTAPSAGWSAGRRFSSDGTWRRSSVPESLVVTFWGYLVGLWEKAGCGLDPSGGLCTTYPSTPEPSDNGCGLDPHGGCETGTNSVGGSAANQDAGCGLDPSGACG